MSVQKDQACPGGQFVNYISMLTAEDICDMCRKESARVIPIN